MRKITHGIIGGMLSLVMMFAELQGFGGQQITVKAAETENLIKNPDFAADGDLSVWSVAQGGAVITAETAQDPIFGSVTTYGKITGRNSNYECFAQDVTNVVENNEVYEYTFYVMLDKEDYDGAPANKRTVEISPFITVNGSTTYSQGVSGTVTQALEPGVWTKFSGTYCPSWTGEAQQVAIRILEQGTNYGQGEGVMGTYYVTGVQLSVPSPDLLIDEDAINFCDAMTEQMGEDFIAGTSICNGDLTDLNEMALVTKHFNALTLGNELKPDAMFGYSNAKVPGTETAVLNGEEIVVPKMDYSRAEKTLNYVYNWNQKHPDKQIKVRGHVLVWHSQTPEWWFHEDYDATKPYVDTDTMNKRLEWYIKTMAEHFTGPDSKYYGMFYGWDVVNEAVSDGGARYRNASENSSWWAVYQSQEFIINAFRYANKYMDPSVDLYYNDYNECSPTKRQGIVQLLTDVKEADGTRIDGMGMQGHYGTSGNPSAADFEASARAFAAVVDKVQITEFDMGASDFYNGKEETKASEYSMQAYRYKEIYDVVKQLKSEGINFAGITFWGVVDKYSWLQSASNVGGGTDGTRKQCPLLFDDDYQIKPAFWAFADQSRLKPVAKTLVVMGVGAGGNMNASGEYSFASGNTGVTFKAAWNKNSLIVKVTVDDTSKDESDCFIVYASVDGKNILKKEIKRSEAIDRLLKGYEYSVKLELDEAYMHDGGEIFFDIVAWNGDDAIAFSDKTMSQETSTEYYIKAVLQDNPDNKQEEVTEPTSTPTPTPAQDPTKEPEKQEEVTPEPTAAAGDNTDSADTDGDKEASGSDNADIADGESQSVDAAQQDTANEQTQKSSNGWAIAALGIVAILAVAAVAIVVVVKKNKSK